MNSAFQNAILVSFSCKKIRWRYKRQWCIMRIYDQRSSKCSQQLDSAGWEFSVPWGLWANTQAQGARAPLRVPRHRDQGWGFTDHFSCIESNSTSSKHLRSFTSTIWKHLTSLYLEAQKLNFIDSVMFSYFCLIVMFFCWCCRQKSGVSLNCFELMTMKLLQPPRSQLMTERKNLNSQDSGYWLQKKLELAKQKTAVWISITTRRRVCVWIC